MEKNTFENQEGMVYIPVEKLRDHKDNPRKDLGDLTELTDSIKQNGVLQNLTVVKNADDSYTIIIGHRRKAAAKLAGVTVLPCMVVDMTPQEQVGTMLLENMQRSDLTIYEQAQGFQMMLDLGESIEGIAKKTGFSKTTVNRRLEMAKLNQETLKEVSCRQISIGDIDRLSQIDDIEKRNEVLKDIGTHNFNQTVEYAIKKQNIRKNLEGVKKEIRRLGAKRIQRSETYGGKYSRIGNDIAIDKWQENDALVPADENRKLFYCLEEDYGRLAFYYEVPKAKPQKRSQKEINREKYIEEVRLKLDELTETAYQLRHNFVSKISLTKQNERAMLDGVAGLLAVLMFSYVSTSQGRDEVFAAAGIVYDYGHAEDSKIKFLQQLEKSPSKIIPILIYRSFGDYAQLGYYSKYRKEFPVYTKNLQLDALYKWLVSVGYEMSDDEKALQDGTHPLFTDRDKEE